MTDKKFQVLINQVARAGTHYQSLLLEAEKEYERRFGYSPSDLDDDGWIDALHINPSSISVKEVTESAELRLSQNL